jgi:hypothetical protein
LEVPGWGEFKLQAKSPLCLAGDVDPGTQPGQPQQVGFSPDSNFPISKRNLGLFKQQVSSFERSKSLAQLIEQAALEKQFAGSGNPARE